MCEVTGSVPVRGSCGIKRSVRHLVKALAGAAQVTSTWRKVAPKFEGEDAYEALEKIDRLEVFQQYIRCGIAKSCRAHHVQQCVRDAAGLSESLLLSLHVLPLHVEVSCLQCWRLGKRFVFLVMQA